MSLTMLAIVPSVALLVYIYKKDKKEKEPIRFLIGCFIFGVLTAIPAVILEDIEDALFSEIFTKGSFVGAIIDAFVVAALSEELFKYLFLKKKTWKSQHFDCMFDGIVYSVFVSLGFATLENILYVFDSGLGTAVLRMFTSIPGHTCFAVYMGYFYSKAKREEVNGNKAGSKKFRKKALWVPVLLHGLYDFCLMLEEEQVGEGLVVMSILAWLVYLIVLFSISFRLVSASSREDRYMIENWQCECGSDNMGNYCTVCGKKRP